VSHVYRINQTNDMLTFLILPFSCQV